MLQYRGVLISKVGEILLFFFFCDFEVLTQVVEHVFISLIEFFAEGLDAVLPFWISEQVWPSLAVAVHLRLDGVNEIIKDSRRVLGGEYVEKKKSSK